MSTGRWIDKKAVEHIHNRILLSHYKEYIWISSNEVDETGAYYTEWSKPEKKKKKTSMQYTKAYMEFRKVVMITLYVRQTAKETQMYRTDFWTLKERERVGWFGRMALKHVYYHVRNKVPVYVRNRIQDAWGWCMGMIQRDDMGWEVGGVSGFWTHVHPWRIHVNVRQNQYSIVK